MSEVIKFGTDGWRAIIADEFTLENVTRAVYAIGLYIKQAYYAKGQSGIPVLIGYDTRFLADKFAKHAAEVLLDLGINAKLAVRDVPTPCIAWAAQNDTTAGALQFTASHNPPEYCGLKYIPHFGGPATTDITNAIVAHLQDAPADYKPAHHDVDFFDPQPPYLEALGKLVDLKKISGSGLRIGFDALYSTSRGYLDRVLRDQCGLSVAVLHDWRDPLFGGGMPEPKLEFLKDLVALVKKDKLDVGLATDGDADRFSVIDENGNFFTPNQLLCMLTRHLVKNRKLSGTIVRTVATTHLLDRLAKMYGLKVHETKVGFKYIGEVMRKEDVLIAGEESGGFSVKGHIPEKDGIIANLFLVEMLAYEKKPLTSIWDDLLKEAGAPLTYKRADLKLTTRTAKGFIDHLNEHSIKTLAGRPIVEESRLDGLKLYLDHENWMMIRPSGTEPLIRLYFEATTSENAEEMKRDFQAQADAILADLERSAPSPAKAQQLKESVR